MENNEQLLPLVQAVQAATGRRVHLSTVWRWCVHGRLGIRMESVALSGRRMTSVESVRRYIAAVTAASPGGTPVTARPATNRQREADIARAERELRDLGL